MLEEIHGLAEQYQHICQSAHTVVDKSLKKTLLLTRCVPRSRINLLTSQHGHKENGGQYGANTSINSC